MNEAIQNSNSEGINSCPKVPRSIVTANRKELDVELVIQGELPSDVQGHIFIVGPEGTVDSEGLPFKNGNTCLNGDGMVYRLDFNKSHQVTLKSRIANPPDYQIDDLVNNYRKNLNTAQPESKVAKWLGQKIEFRNHGVARFSSLLGMRNELNTAFLPMLFNKKGYPASQNDPEKQYGLLIAYDVGRSYILDTETLEVLNPIGSEQEWQAELEEIPAVPLPFRPKPGPLLFKPILSTAHPVFDSYTGEMFTVNYGRSIENLISTMRLVKEIEAISPRFKRFLNTLSPDLKNFFYLISWNSAGKLQKWKLLLPDGSPLKITQTVHQIGVTKDYVVLMHTSFNSGVEQLVANSLTSDGKLDRLLREKILETTPDPNTLVYIVRRSDLQPDVEEVIVRKVTIQREAAHFLVDYENPNDEITLHISQIGDWYVAEWLRQTDKFPYPGDRASVPRDLCGMVDNPLDVSWVGRHVIDGSSTTESPLQSKTILDKRYTWGPDLYAYFDGISLGQTPGKLKNIYWTTFGLWEELMTQVMYDIYQNYQYQTIPFPEILKLAQEGKPSCLIRVDTTAMEIADHYEFPSGYLACSPQFMPRKGNISGHDDSTWGYIVCTVFTPDGSEIWLFDGEDLKKGVVCKFSHPDLVFGFTLHTAWLPKLERYSGNRDWWNEDLVAWIECVKNKQRRLRDGDGESLSKETQGELDRFLDRICIDVEKERQDCLNDLLSDIDNELLQSPELQKEVQHRQREILKRIEAKLEELKSI